MAKALHNLELSAMHFHPWLLLLGGIVLLAAGLCVWLGGLRWAVLVAAAIGGLTGLICVYALTDRALPALIIAPLIAAGLAAFLKKPVLVLSGAGGAAAVTWLLLAAPDLRTETLHGPSHPVPRDGAAIGMLETAAAINEELAFWGKTFAEAVKRLSPAGWAAGGAAAAIALGAGFVFSRLVAAVTCAGIGAACIALGMVFLLLYKGAAPLTAIYNKAAFFWLTMLIMIGFGTLSQLLLCPSQRHKPQEYAERKGGKKK